MAANSINLYARIVINSNCSRYSFADRSIFIIYEKIQSRLIKGIKDSQVQPLGRDTITLNYLVNDKCVKVSLTNVLHIPDIKVNLLSIDKLLDADIAVAFQKADYFLTKNNLKLMNTRNRDLFFLDLWNSLNSVLTTYSVPSDLIHQL